MHLDVYPHVEHTDPSGQTRKDFTSDQDVRWCPGCGDYAILAQVQRVLPELGIPRENYAFISGIGCSSRFPYYLDTYGMHSIHGRAPAIATGLKATRPELSVWVITGDGDALSIGGNHFLHVLRRNVDVKILLFNNRIYGLTKGQYSPTSEVGKLTKSTPLGSLDYPVDPVSIALGAGATFVARTVDVNVKHLQQTLKRAAAHKGSAVVEIYQNCNIFNDGAFSFLTDKQTRADNELQLEHDQPLRFGKEKDKGIVLNRRMHPEVVNVADVDAERLLVHDEQNEVCAFTASHLKHPDFPTPIGVFRAVERPTYDSLVEDQMQHAVTKKGQKSVQDLLDGGETWEVKGGDAE